MKKLFFIIAAAMLAVNVWAEPIELELTNLEVTDYGADRQYTYSSNDVYKVSLDIYTDFQWVAGTKYGLTNVDPDYSKITNTKTYVRYSYTELEFVFGENKKDIEITATGKYSNPGTGEDEFISIHAVYVEKEKSPIDVALFGSYEYQDYGSKQIYQFMAESADGTISADIPVLAAELVSGSTYSIAEGTIHSSAMIGGVTLAEAALTLTYLELEQAYFLVGPLKDLNGQVYNVQIIASLPEPQEIELSFYNTVLSEDEGDIKFKYQDDEYQLICYLTPKIGDDLTTMTLVGGEYSVLSYSKFGPMGEFGYESGALADAHALVEVDEEATVLTLTFSQNGDDYTIVASTGEKKVNTYEVKQSEVGLFCWEAPECNVVTTSYPEDWYFQLIFNAEEGIAEGEYVLDIESSNVANSNYTETYYFVEGSKVTLTKSTAWTGEDCWVITGELVTKDGDIFKITLSTEPAKADVDVPTIMAEDATVVCNFRNERWSIETAFGMNSIRLHFANTEYAGEYSETWHLGYDNVLVYDDVVADDVQAVSMKSVVEGDNVHVTGWIILYSYDTDKTYYVPVDLKGAMVEEAPAEGDEQSDLTVTLTKVNLVDNGWGSFDFSATNEDGYELVLIFSYGVSLDAKGHLPEGELPISTDWDIEARIDASIEIPQGGFGPGPLSLEEEEEPAVPDGSYITDGEKFWFLYEGSATIAYSEEGALQMTINAKNTAGNALTITIDEDMSGTGINNVTAVKVVKAIENGQLIINRDGEKFNVMGVKL